MVLGADGAYYVDAASAVAGARASALGVFPSLPDNENAIFGNFGGNTAGSGIPSGNSVSFDLGGNVTAGSSGTPSVLPATKSLGAASFLNGVLHPLDSLKGLFDPAQAAANAGQDQATGNTIDSGKAALAFITDIPRVATTLLGLILVIAGIFALTKGPAVNIVTSAVRGAVTS